MTRLVVPALMLFAAILCATCLLRSPAHAQESAERLLFLKYKVEAENGNAMAQYDLGVCYDQGKGVEKDYVQAVKWYRKAAEQNHADAQCNLGACYALGEGVEKDYVQAVKWYRKAAEQNHANAQYNLGVRYSKGEGVEKDGVEAVKWYRKAAEQNLAMAQYNLGVRYDQGEGVEKDYVQAVKWYRKAAEQNHANAQYNLGVCYDNGEGVEKDYVEAYAYFNLAAKTKENAGKARDSLEKHMSPQQVADAQNRTKVLRAQIEAKLRLPEKVMEAPGRSGPDSIAGSGTGFFITTDGFLITNEHVVEKATEVDLLTRNGRIRGRVVKTDPANDLALVKATGEFTALPLVTSRGVRLGNVVVTVGFPNISLQGLAPKFGRGEIGALSGLADDPRYFQISVPVQPGNSGSALVDLQGNVIGVVTAKLSAGAAFVTSGALPENVNYAVKGSFILGFLESDPELVAKLQKPNEKQLPFDTVVKALEEASVIVIVE